MRVDLDAVCDEDVKQRLSDAAALLHVVNDGLANIDILPFRELSGSTNQEGAARFRSPSLASKGEGACSRKSLVATLLPQSTPLPSLLDTYFRLFGSSALKEGVGPLSP